MKRRWRILLVVAGCGLVAAAALVLLRDRQPEYKGRTLTEWLLDYSPQGFYPPRSYVPSRRAADRREAAEAVRQIGTNALPWLVKWIRYEGDRSSINRLREAAVPKVPPSAEGSFMVRRLLTDKAGLRAGAAVAGFEILGAQARPAVPGLARVLEESKAVESADRAMICLAVIGTDGLPPLLATVTNQAKPGRVRGLGTRYIAYLAAQIKTNANPAVPVLVQCLEDRDPQVAQEAAIALGELAIEPGVTGPALTNALRNSDRLVRCLAAQSLGRFGRRAGAGVPALVNALNDAESVVREAATNALREIDPEVLEKAEGAGPRTN